VEYFEISNQFNKIFSNHLNSDINQIKSKLNNPGYKSLDLLWYRSNKI